MAFAYEILIEKHNLKVEELPEEVQIAIDGIKDSMKGINMAKKTAEKNGKVYKESEGVIKKTKQLDSWACRSIREYLDGKETSTDAPTDGEEILELINNEKSEPTVELAEGNEIDLQLQAMLTEGITEVSTEVLKDRCPKAYKLIFESYVEGEENGLETTNFSLTENESKNYILTKN